MKIKLNRKMRFVEKIKFVLLVKVIISRHLEYEACCQLPVLLFETYRIILRILSTIRDNIVRSVKCMQK